MVNWMRTWRRASYRGAEFWVDKDEVSTGRRLVVHQFPHRDTPYIEDMGREAGKVQVTAYVASDNALAESQKLYNACERGGAATLQLPEEKLKAQCESCQRAWDKDKQGFLAFSLTFWRDGTGPGPFPSAYLQRLAFSAALDVPDTVGAMLARSVSTIERAGYVRDLAAEKVRAIATALDTVRVALPLAADRAPAITRAIQDLYDEAPTLAAIGAAGDRFERQSFIALETGSAEVPPLAARIGSVVEALRDAATSPAAARVALEPLIEAFDVPTVAASTPSGQIAQQNGVAMDLALGAVAIAQWAVAVTEVTYEDRRSAVQARADISERFEVIVGLADAAGAPDVCGTLAEVRDAAVRFISRVMTDLAPVQIYETGTSMPSLWWAWRLYGDAARAGVLAQRNRAIHASFMPREVEAVAR